MGKPTRWSRPYYQSAAGFGTFVANNPIGSTFAEFMNVGETLRRVITTAEFNIIYLALSDANMDTKGWWSQYLIGFGMYIPSLKAGWSPTIPDPIGQSADDHWIFNELLVVKHVELNPLDTQLTVTWGFPTDRLDVMTAQGPVAEGAGQIIYWTWHVQSVGDNYYNDTGVAVNSYMGLRVQSQLLFTTP